MKRISLIVCTLNRATSLDGALRHFALAIGTRRNIEVVIIDNGSEDNTKDVIVQWASSVSFPVKYAYVGTKGLSVARNIAISASSGDLLVFTDDDCHMDRDFFTCLERHYEGDAVPVMRGGRVELGDPSDMPFTIKTDIVPEQMNDVHFPGGFVIGANMVIPRAIIEDVGLFDERFGAGAYLKAAEDTDYIHRVYRKGYRVEYQPDFLVHHFHGRKTLNDIKKLHEQYNIGNGALYAKHCTDLKLLRHFYWDCRKAVKGVAPHEGIDLSSRAVVVGNIKGVFKYVYLSVRAYGRRILTVMRHAPAGEEVVLQFGPQLHAA